MTDLQKKRRWSSEILIKFHHPSHLLEMSIDSSEMKYATQDENLQHGGCPTAFETPTDKAQTARSQISLLLFFF